MTKPLDYFITGACGMIGSHLMAMLALKNSSYLGTFHNPQTDLGQSPLNYTPCDVRDFAAVSHLISHHLPRTIFHLAAQSYPTVSWERPAETVSINVNGTINLFEAIRQARKNAPTYDPLVLVACSSAQYGSSMPTDGSAIKEDAPMLPLHPYGMSKVGQDLLARQYHQSIGIRTLRARIFNTTGARKKHDVVADWAFRTAAIERNGKSGDLRVGNLSARRAIMDVGDLLEALNLLIEKGEPGEAYNVCHDRLIGMDDLFHVFQSLARVPLKAVEDTALLRTADEPVIYGDCSKLKAATGWVPTTALKTTVERVLNYARTTLDTAR
jgi:GDP-4-dehydro-6-deoxy-D-mannose reductase